MKKVLFLLLVSLFAASVCFAAPSDTPVDKPDVIYVPSIDTGNKPTIGIFLEAPVTYVNNETVRKAVPEKAKSLFSPLLFNVLPFDQTSTELRTYKEDHRMIITPQYSLPVNRQDIQAISKGLNCNYALFIIISNDAPRFSAGLFSTTFRTTVTCDVRLLNVDTGKYITSKQIVKDGSSTAIYAGVPSFNNAYNEALEKALNELTIDTTQLLTAPAIN